MVQRGRHRRLCTSRRCTMKWLKHIVTGGLALGIFLLLPGCAAQQQQMPEAGQSQTEQPVEYVVDLSAVEGTKLADVFNGSADYASYAGQLVSATATADPERRTVEVVIETTVSDVTQACTLGEAVVQCVSDHATVTHSEESASEDAASYGTLYAVYGASVHITTAGPTLVLDGWLPAGSDSMMWQ